MTDDLQITQGLSIPASCLSWTSSRASGPGGQNVNKTASKVQLRFAFADCDVLEPNVKHRLRALAAERLDADGQIYIVSQTTRSMLQNLEDAKARLADLIRRALVVPKRRRPTKPTQSSQRRRVGTKRLQGEKKRERGLRHRD
jgi:ribosome-associated protein